MWRDRYAGAVCAVVMSGKAFQLHAPEWMLLSAFLLTIFAYGLISRRAEHTLLSAPLIVTAAGLGLGSILVRRGSGVDAADVLFVGELALAAMLFTSASAIRFRTLVGDRWLPLRLLLVADPLIVALGALFAMLLLPPLTVIEACIVGTLLAPSAGSVAAERSPAVPPRIRRALGVESGLNGLAVPLLLLFIAMDQPQFGGALSWLPIFLRQVLGGVGVGAAIGGAGGWLVGRAWKSEWMSPMFTPLALLALALMSWSVAESILGVNGFIASFVAGTLVGIGHGKPGEHLIAFTASWGQLLDLAVLFLFGGLMAPTVLRVPAEAVLYALASLTIVRMLPVAISMIGAGLHWSTVLFVGWFGPRGLGSIVLGLVFLETEARFESQSIILEMVGLTVLASVFAHELSARPLIGMYGRRVERLGDDAPENLEAADAPATHDERRRSRPAEDPDL